MVNTLSFLPIPLLQWYGEHARDLPWRREPTPYRVWVSEIMLQQTRVAAVLGYFAKFMDAFPTVQDLAAAPEDQLMKLWQGLGYYSRARNLQKAARQIVDTFGGAFPRTMGTSVPWPGWETIPPRPLPPSPLASLSPRWTAICCGWPPG